MYIQSLYDDFSYECFSCDEKDKMLCQAADYADELVKLLYITDKTDVTKIQIALDNLCDCLKVKTIDGDINIERKKEQHILEDWIEKNNTYLYSLANNKKPKG